MQSLTPCKNSESSSDTKLVISDQNFSVQQKAKLIGIFVNKEMRQKKEACILQVLIFNQTVEMQ